jgi:hypothetical protein
VVERNGCWLLWKGKGGGDGSMGGDCVVMVVCGVVEIVGVVWVSVVLLGLSWKL